MHRNLDRQRSGCASERNWSLWGSIYSKARNRLAVARAEKLAFIRGNSRQLSVSDDNMMLELLNEVAQADEAAQEAVQQLGTTRTGLVALTDDCAVTRT